MSANTSGKSPIPHPAPVKQANEINGILNSYKPVGMTSFGVVAALRRRTGLKRIGHCGTLDPFAEGVLPLCLGRATAAVQFMDAYDKSYRAELCLGWSTTTEDRTGEVVERLPVSPEQYAHWSEEEGKAIREALKATLGEQEQVPPMYSAIKQGGVPLYKLARQGLEVERKARRISVYEARLLEIGPYDPESRSCKIHIEWSVSKGTYIRTLAADLARALGSCGHLNRLVRTACGPFTLETALREDRWDDWAQELQPADQALSRFPSLPLERREGLHLLQGKVVELTERHPQYPMLMAALSKGAPSPLYRVYGRSGDGEPRFLGLARCQVGTDEPNAHNGSLPLIGIRAERMFLAIENY